MADSIADKEAYLEVLIPGRSPELVPVFQSPFLIGRGSDTGNHLHLEDRRISRRCAAIVFEEGAYHVEDRGHRQGIFVNGERIEQKALMHGDTIQFGVEDCCEIVFRSSTPSNSVESMLVRLNSISSVSATVPSGSLSRLNLLLEATSLLHSQLPLDSVLGTMLDHAISVTQADRGMLVELNSGDSLNIRLARSSAGVNLPLEGLSPSRTALRQAIERRSSVITADLDQADVDLKQAQSVLAQRLRLVVVIPLFAMPRASSDQSQIGRRGPFLGSLYFDSQKPAAFSNLDLQILDALGMEAASILDNARLVERERERQRLEQELSIARAIQQALLPQGMQSFPYLEVSSVHFPCHEVGGDYFDVFPISEDRTAVLIADVAGKGLGAALLATMLQGALTGMTLGADPVRVFNHVNRFLCKHSELGRYATIFFGILGRDGTLEFIRAGHPSPLLLRRGVVSELDTGGTFPVGLIEDVEFSSKRTKLEPEDMLMLFSDGITEAEDRHQNQFKLTRLRGLLEGRVEYSIESLQRTVLDSVRDFSEGAPQSDDITLLLVRYGSRGETCSED